jgi:hypothetical protein
MDWGSVDACLGLVTAMHDGGWGDPGRHECPFCALGSRNLGDGETGSVEVRGGEQYPGSGLDGCVGSDGTAGADGRCDPRGCGPGRGGDAWNSAAMARPTGREEEEEAVWCDDAGLALGRIQETDSRQRQLARWIYVK